VSQAVDAEGGLLDEEAGFCQNEMVKHGRIPHSHSQDTTVDETTQEITPAETADKGGHNQSHGHHGLEIVAVLPDDNGIIVQVGNVGAANAAGVLLHDHPADVAVEQALADGVGILLGIGVAVMRAVKAGPPPSAALDGGSATGGEEDLEGKGGLVAGMSPQAMVTGSWKAC